MDKFSVLNLKGVVLDWHAKVPTVKDKPAYGHLIDRPRNKVYVLTKHKGRWVYQESVGAECKDR